MNLISEGTLEPDITELLGRLAGGDKEAEQTLIKHVYPQLRKLAGGILRSERADHSLQPSALVNEAYIRLKGGSLVNWNGRNHFFAVCAQLMRRILVDHARGRIAEKRGGAFRQSVPLDELMAAANTHRPETYIAIDECLSRLATMDPRKAKVVEMRFFGGLSEEEIADVLSVSSRTVKRDWIYARAWLHAELNGEKL